MVFFFQRPTEIFKNAAKHEETDHLLGTIDAMAWGMEAPVGTGGSFDILYSAKVIRYLACTVYSSDVGKTMHMHSSLLLSKCISYT